MRKLTRKSLDELAKTLPELKKISKHHLLVEEAEPLQTPIQRQSLTVCLASQFGIISPNIEMNNTFE
ncbi:MAG: hypothetical protein PHQ11_00965 [Paludibacter sp.]|nr:hypothetical protein [Paludibacter sp.]MDD4198394.1 hypothetical protein [Paludibacter sp.]MDD4427072.1 hypothetical protein [Paludibacter sp.]